MDRISARESSSEAFLQARLEDAALKASRGTCAMLPFLTPLEQKQAQRYLTRIRLSEQAFWFGGYPNAERARLFLLPEYILQCLSVPLAECELSELSALYGEPLQNAVCPIWIRGSGYRELTHRDYLGAVMGLGLERDAFGDIVLQGTSSAVLFCTDTVACFLEQSLTKVATDPVVCRPGFPPSGFQEEKRYQSVCDTVASARLDCIVAALTGHSREHAQEWIRRGAVEVDYQCEERVDALLHPPFLLSVRGCGKFRVLPFDGETKKGRLRLRAEKFI